MNIEKIRAGFEEWYETTGWDPHATWHPHESLEYGKETYPHGRYTIMSLKQTCWEVWLAAKTRRNCRVCVDERRKDRKEIKVELGYARVGLKNT